ncbi:diguanylate cyclase [Legionella maceachernii]|uniref:diguanylate cyclase n=1 Tax=Legionella maceachernii TaxID=466 RepID=A0A0W0VYC4_9GAMM|nr:diguanylate cyclase [Legionella maceachernii]KTD25184.1 sensor histidine kinase [Legionella maceachernii]SJZ75795.1 diguanylate cyclase (GGDEF) domain-containing protein [Legionella maceachernii]SUP03163.1 Diguanylate cyclase YdeH [Legionella maceachernii]
MQINSLSREELQEAILQLEQALYNHQQWHNALIRSLTCRLPADQHDMSQDAHKECRFGQWYYRSASEKLRQLPGFSALGEEHLKMHKEATNLLSAIDNGRTIQPFDYDNFSNALEKVRLEISALQRELGELLYNRDALTGAINRTSMLAVLREQQNLVKRNIQACSIVMLDLDHFKKVNDQYGHTAGDYVLASISRFIIEHLRPYDKFFRVGGEEFLICLQNADAKFALKIIKRLGEGIASMKINVNQNEAIHVTVSFGIAEIENDITVEQSIEHADQALYKAKAEGRNCARI